MADIFARWYAAVNVEWPQFGLGAEEAHMQERRWRGALGDYDSDTLMYAMNEAIKTHKKRPRPADFVDLCVAHARGKHGLKPHREPEWEKCSCGCGGTKWLLVLRNAEGVLRRFPVSMELLTEKMPEKIAKIPAVVALLEPLVGAPMTRVKQHCLHRGGDELPTNGHRIGEEGGIPVYDLRRAAGGET